MEYTITATQVRIDYLISLWESEREDWGDDHVDFCISQVQKLTPDQVITYNDQDDIDESQATPEEMFALGIEYYGL